MIILVGATTDSVWRQLLTRGRAGADSVDGANGSDGSGDSDLHSASGAVNRHHRPSTLLTEDFNGVDMTHDEPFAGTRGSYRSTWGPTA